MGIIKSNTNSINLTSIPIFNYLFNFNTLLYTLDRDKNYVYFKIIFFQIKHLTSPKVYTPFVLDFFAFREDMLSFKKLHVTE